MQHYTCQSDIKRLTRSSQPSNVAGALASRRPTYPSRHRTVSLCAQRQLAIVRRNGQCLFGPPPTCRSSACPVVCAVQQTESRQAAATEQAPQSSSAFGISSSQLQSLAEHRGAEVFASSEFSSVYQLAQSLRVSTDFGLVSDASDLEARRAAFGSNTLPEKQEITFLELVKGALDDFTVQILLASGIVSSVLGVTVDPSDAGWIEGVAILLAVAVVVAVTALNDYQKEKQFKQLSKVSEQGTATVVRDGTAKDISIFDLVVGDVLVFETGDILPADAVLISGTNIRLDESQLTGEADECVKEVSGDPLLLSGSKVLEGSGRGLVIAVGLNSQAGIIAGLCQQPSDAAAGLRETTVLEAKLESLASLIGKIGLGAGLLAFAALASQFSWQHFVVQGQAWDWSLAPAYLRFLIISITILVVAIPEGLPLAVTIALAYSVKRMLKDNNLVRHLGAAETMGTATTICTDKTGTLTQNDMQVVRMWLGGQDHTNLQKLDPPQPAGEEDLWQDIPLGLDPRVQDLLGNSIALNSTASVRYEDGAFTKVGNRTECALLELCAKLGMDAKVLQESHQIVQVYPFTSDRKRMSSITFQTGASIEGMMCARLFTKGAAEQVLELCNLRIRDDSGVARFSQQEKQDLLDSFSRDGNRMLAIAYRDIFLPFQSSAAGQQWGGEEYAAWKVEKELTLIALVGIQDPLRPQVPASIQHCRRAGITVRMLTGDSSTTACAIARECGILSSDSCPSIGLPAELKPLAATKTLDGSVLSSSSSLDASYARSLSGSTASTSGSHSSQDGASAALSTPVSAVLGNTSNGNGSGPSATSSHSSTDHQYNHNGGGNAATDSALVLEGNQFRSFVMSPDGSIDKRAFDAIWPRLRVLARCSPTDKYTIVQALKADPTEIVAMTGDGTNDAPALRSADVGFAMMSGTSIAKEASDILLMDNNFTSVVEAVKWGRSVYAGITKFLQFQLTVNVVAVTTAVVGAVAVQESPLTAVQMLWLNLIMDSLASLALATESPTDAMLDLPPYSARQSLLTPTVSKHIVGQSIFQLAVMYGLVFGGAQLFGVPEASSIGGPSQHYTLVFNAFVLMQLFNQVNARRINDEANVFGGMLSNKFFLVILLSEAILQVLIVQYGGEWFQTVPLSPVQWAACTGIGATSLLVRAGLRLIPSNKRN